MKQLTKLIKTILTGGLFVLLPLLLLYLLLAEMLELVVALATPIANLFPEETFAKVNAPVLLGVILIVGVSFIFGLALHSQILRQFGLWIESTLLDQLPFYAALKNLSKGLIGDKTNTAFRPAVANMADGAKEIVYVIEDHGDGNLTILVPRAPTSFSGPVKIIPRDRIEMLDSSLDQASSVLTHWGVGAADLLNKHKRG